MVYSPLADLKTILEAYNGSWTSGNPTVYIDVNGKPTATNANGYIKIVEGNLGESEYVGGQRNDPWTVRIEPEFPTGETNDTKILAICNDIKKAIDAKLKLGGRSYFTNSRLESWDRHNALMFISMLEELIVY